jgi:hypothetical protein|tara:strand:- start:127 stop:243 length:117 start_codon:yes stop_codon:yes gene_type:complete
MMEIEADQYGKTYGLQNWFDENCLPSSSEEEPKQTRVK